MSPAGDERDRIRAAMARILDGVPARSNGALTIVALATEADVPRNALTPRHTDLKNEFYARAAERGGVSEQELQLRAMITNLKKTIENKNTELTQLRRDVPTLVRVVNQLTVENQRLREALTNPHVTVIPLLRRSAGLPHAVTPCRAARRRLHRNGRRGAH